MERYKKFQFFKKIVEWLEMTQLTLDYSLHKFGKLLRFQKCLDLWIAIGILGWTIEKSLSCEVYKVGFYFVSPP